MRLFLMILPFLASAAMAGQNEVYQQTSVNGSAIAPSSVTINADNVSAQSGFPEAPLQITGKTNSPLQAIIQNQSNGTNASGVFVIQGDLSGQTSFYTNLGMNSSRFSQAAQFGAEPSSAGFLSTSDSDLFIEAGVNGNANGGPYGSQNSPSIVFITSTPVNANRMMVISTSAITIPSVATVTIQGTDFSVGGATLVVSGGITKIAVGATTATVGGYMFFDSTATSVSTVTTNATEVIFSTWNIPANTINQNGLCIYFSCNGKGSAASLSRQTRIYLNGYTGTILAGGSVTSTNQDQHATTELCRYDAKSAVFHGDLIQGTSSVGTASNGTAVIAVNWGALNQISCAGKVSSGGTGDWNYQYSKGDIH